MNRRPPVGRVGTGGRTRGPDPEERHYDDTDQGIIGRAGPRGLHGRADPRLAWMAGRAGVAWMAGRAGVTWTAGRVHAAWMAAHVPAAGVPRWARLAACAIPLTVLPSSVWRIAVSTFHAPIARGDLSDVTSSNLPGVPLALYVVLLSIASELLAFTAVGLVSTWGEVVPAWIPGLRGRRVPALVAAVPAGLGATVLTLLWTWTAVSLSLGLRIDGRPQAADAPLAFSDWQGLLAVAAYAPLLLWGPLLGAATVSYWKRRRRPGAPDPVAK